MPTMRMPWSKSGNLQLDLLDAPAVPATATAPPPAPGASARSASMVPTASLREDTHNPRTEIPEAELDELRADIRQHGILQPIVVHPADAEGRLSYIVVEAARLRVPASVLLRMGLNVALELIIGAVPVAGDLFDFVFKANERNVRLLEASLGPPEQVQALRRRSGWAVAAALAVPALVLLLALALVFGLVALVVAGLFR
jgi:Domain of unknown function (DUF4112)/ParB-like nuclease domain